MKRRLGLAIGISLLAPIPMRAASEPARKHVAVLVPGPLLASASLRAASGAAPALPSDPKRWIGAPQSWPSLRGQVVLLDVWTFG